MQLFSRIKTIFVFKWHYSNEQCYLIYTKGNTEISVNKTLKGHLKKVFSLYKLHLKIYSQNFLVSLNSW